MELNDEARRWVQVLIVKAAQATSFCGSGYQKLVEQYLCETVKAAGNAYGAMLKCGRLGDDFEGAMTRAREACEYADTDKCICIPIPGYQHQTEFNSKCQIHGFADRRPVCSRCFFPAIHSGLCIHHLEQQKRAVAS